MWVVCTSVEVNALVAWSRCLEVEDLMDAKVRNSFISLISSTQACLNFLCFMDEMFVIDWIDNSPSNESIQWIDDSPSNQSIQCESIQWIDNSSSNESIQRCALELYKSKYRLSPFFCLIWWGGNFKTFTRISRESLTLRLRNYNYLQERKLLQTNLSWQNYFGS